MPGPKPGTPRREQRETRLVADYLATKYPTSITQQFVRLGAVLPTIPTENLEPGEIAVLKNFGRIADGIVFRDNEIIIIEGMIFPYLGKLSQLQTYLMLFPLTADMARHKDKQLRGVLVGPIEDPVLTAMGSKVDIAWETFRPPWVLDYLEQIARISPRKTRETKGRQLGA